MELASTTAEVLASTVLIYEFLKSGELFWKLFFSFAAGALGSTAYITALNFHFVTSSKEQRDKVIKPFYRKYTDSLCYKKVGWYAFIGGSVASIFQVDVPTFVPVQSLILGATWPAVISQFLSGKMTESIPDFSGLKTDNPEIDQSVLDDF